MKIYEYTRGLLHSKTLTIDGCWSLVGTPNFDARSLMLNFEVAVALYDAKTAAQLESHFETDLKYSVEIELDQWLMRPARQRFPENVCRLFAPIL